MVPYIFIAVWDTSMFRKIGKAGTLKRVSIRPFPHIGDNELFFKALMKERILLICLLLFVSIEAEELNVKVKAKSAILYNPENGAVLFRKRDNDPFYPASIMKIATALYILENHDLDHATTFRASKDALTIINANIRQADLLSYPPYILEHDGVRMGIQEGEQYSMQTLLHGLLLVSANDAANVLAEGLGGSIPNFVDQMNQFLQEKGLKHTRFQNPHGLFHPAQMTTAYDMARIAGMAFAHPVFKKIALTPLYEGENGKILRNTNRFLREGKYKYAKYIGGKTGYIASSGHNLVAGAEHNGRKLIAVLLGCKKVGETFEDAMTLFETAFLEKPKQRRLFAKDHEQFVRKDKKFKTPLKAILKQDLHLEYFSSEAMEIEAKIIWYKPSTVIEEGAEVGSLVIQNQNGIILTSAPLFAANCVFIHQKNRFFYGLILFVGLLGALLCVKFLKQRVKLFKR